jgi:hypothetical protein
MILKYSISEFTILALKHLAGLGFQAQETRQDPDGTVFVHGIRTARRSGFGDGDSKPHHCKFEWPIECFCQCGGSGIVIGTGGPSIEEALTDPEKGEAVVKTALGTGKVPHRRTAFFEAFPRNPKTFLRGEGASIEEAEQDCWNKYQKILACTNHEFERRDRTDGYCFCKHCGLSGMFMQPLHPCTGCGATAYSVWADDIDGKPYCKACFRTLPLEKWNEMSRRHREILAKEEE